MANRKADGSSINSYTYTYDDVGNITAISGSTNATYTYDAQGQLLTETYGGKTYTYTYDVVRATFSRSLTAARRRATPTATATGKTC